MMKILWTIFLGLLDAPEDLCVEEDESADRNNAGEDKSAPVLVIS